MVIVRGQVVIKGPAARADAFDDSVLHQQIENAVDSYTIDRSATLKGIVEVAYGKRICVIPNYFQNPNPIGGYLKVRIRQQLFIITSMAHKSSLMVSHGAFCAFCLAKRILSTTKDIKNTTPETKIIEAPDVRL